MDEQNIEEYKGYCLKHMAQVKLTIPIDEPEAVFTCSLCGRLEERRDESQHILRPMQAIITVLENTKEIQINISKLANWIWLNCPEEIGQEETIENIPNAAIRLLEKYRKEIRWPKSKDERRNNNDT